MNKIIECNECKSKNIILTTHLDGRLLVAVCLDCGWELESPEFERLTNKIEDDLKDFKRDEYLKTKSDIC